MLMKRKKIATLLLALVTTFTIPFSGCGSSKEKTDEVKLNIFQFKVEAAKELKNAANDYMKENPKVKIEVETVGGGDDYGAALKTKFQSGSEPAIFNVGGPQDVKDWDNKLEDLSDQSWLNDALDGTLDGVKVEGKTYGIPFDLEGYGLVYNKRIFKAAGIDPSKITSYESLEEAVKTLDKKIKAGDLKKEFPKLESVFEFPAKATWITGLHTSNAVLGQEFKTSMEAYKTKKLEFKNNEAYKKLIDIQANYSPNSKNKAKLNAVDYANQLEEGLAVERVAIIQQGNWVYGAVKNIDEKVAENLDILPVPVVNGKEDCIPVGVPMYWAINKNKDKKIKDAAKDFLKWLYTSDKGKDYVVNKFFFISPFKGYDNFQPKDALGKAIVRYQKAGKTTPWVFMGYPTAWGMDVLGTNVQKYLAGKMSWDEFVKDAKEQWEKKRSK